MSLCLGAAPLLEAAQGRTLRVGGVGGALGPWLPRGAPPLPQGNEPRAGWGIPCDSSTVPAV